MGRFEKRFESLNWKYIAGAVLDVYHENQCNETAPGAYKANADIWVVNGELRKQLLDRSLHHWCVRSGMDFTRFPFSENYVALTYLAIRKRQQGEVADFDAEVNGESPVLATTLFDD